MKLLLTYMLAATFATAVLAEVPAGHPPVDHEAIAKQAAEQPMPDLKSMTHGKVVSVLNTQGYTYIELSRDKGTAWVAVPETVVKAGDTVHYKDGPAMQNYKSRTLDRTFPSVIFLSQVIVNADTK
ncbi:MAG: hypothetical protein KZQ76_05305 [Candidatus Thiodiazotropha sp. (ex Epidulcina cf. delphinae)]|nr:hypothetical protein [Candidatus Thiodiazotropha sp. (ex Epidulcina cf. delphinae)]